MAGYDTHATQDPTMFFVSLVVTATVVVLIWLIRRSKQQSSNVAEDIPQKKRTTVSTKHGGHKPTKKKQAVLYHKPGSTIQFTHPELLSSLKGHSGSLTSGGFSANGKHFISAADVGSGRRFDPGGRRYREVSDNEARFTLEPGLHSISCNSEDGSSSLEEIDTSSVSSGSHVTTSNDPSDTEDSNSTSKMSRRQRKNKNKKSKVPQICLLFSQSGALSQSTREYFDTLGKTEKQLYDHLLPLCCGVEERVLNGYPYVTNYGVYVFKTSGYSNLAGILSGGFQLVDAEKNVKCQSNIQNILDIEDGHSDYSEPESLEDISTNDFDHDDNQDTSSGISSDSKDSEGDDKDNICDLDGDADSESISQSRNSSFQLIERCKRCKLTFNVNENGSRSCVFHPKKIMMRKDGQLRHQCCNKLKGVLGCTRADMHVYHHLKAGLNGPLNGFKVTKSGRGKVIGLDCEMFFTTDGFELARATLVSITGKVLLDLYVRPKGSVFDYNTQFSGITAEHMNQAVTFTKAREKVLSFVTSSTILIGHSLEGDLAALKIVHRLAVDTSLLFKAPQNYQPLKQSLKSLAKKVLSRDIQKDGHGGHDSLEDATAVLDLVLSHFIESHKVRKIAPLPLALQNVV